MSARPRFGAQDLARIAVFAAIIIVLGMITIPLLSGVPITGQTLGVMLAGSVLGWRRAPFAVLTVLGLAAIGLPVLAGGRGGLGVFLGPSAGYLIGWVAAVLVIGLLVQAGSWKWWQVALANLLGGIGVIYLFGIPVQAFVTGVDLGTTALSSLIFLPGDALKVVVATVLTLALRKAYPAAFGAIAARPALAS